MSRVIIFSFLSIALGACNSVPEIGALPVSENSSSTAPPKDFVQYWYAEKAELSSYALQQNRYGKERNGDAVMIFVTEDFSKEKQVKLDYPKGELRDAVSVMKLNFLKKFKTGVYDYSLMQSVFTPVNQDLFPSTFKAVFSGQDWCGQTFSQINLGEKGKYELKDFSYFESEGDGEYQLKKAILEDEFWNQIRINPGNVPLGEMKMIPAQSFGRLNHKSLKPTLARVTMNKATESASELHIEYLHLERSLKIRFETDFPFKILGWEETDGDTVTSKGTLKRTIRSAYWKQNTPEFLQLRDSLMLSY